MAEVGAYVFVCWALSLGTLAGFVAQAVWRARWRTRRRP